MRIAGLLERRSCIHAVPFVMSEALKTLRAWIRYSEDGTHDRGRDGMYLACELGAAYRTSAYQRSARIGAHAAHDPFVSLAYHIRPPGPRGVALLQRRVLP